MNVESERLKIKAFGYEEIDKMVKYAKIDTKSIIETHNAINVILDELSKGISVSEQLRLRVDRDNTEESQPKLNLGKFKTTDDW